MTFQFANLALQERVAALAILGVISSGTGLSPAPAAPGAGAGARFDASLFGRQPAAPGEPPGDEAPPARLWLESFGIEAVQL